MHKENDGARGVGERPTPMKATQIRIGLYVAGARLPAWLVRAALEVKRSPHARIVAVVVGEAAPEPEGLGARYLALDRRRFRQAPDAFALEPLPDFGVAASPSVASGSSGEGSIDLWIELGTCAMPAPVAARARWGVFSLGIAGVREVFTAQATSACTLRHRSGDGALETVVDASFGATDPRSPTRGQNPLAWKAAALPARALARAARTLHDDADANAFLRAAAKNDVPQLDAGPSTFPSDTELLGMVARKALDYVCRKPYAATHFDQYILMYAFGDQRREDFGAFTRIVPPRDRFWADPFVLYRDGAHHVFFEEFEFSQPRAHLCVLTIDESGVVGAPVRVLERPYHLSYPFLLEHAGELFMVPETGDNAAVELYRCTRFPDQWRFEKTLVAGLRAVDSTIIEHAGRYWLFANVASVPGASVHDELCLFHADSPISNRWEPHPSNPIVSDVRRARPAGALYRQDGVLYRPAQDCSARYGWSMHIQRIDRLDVDGYAEATVRTIRPTWAPDLVSTHTINHSQRLTVVDAEISRWRR